VVFLPYEKVQIHIDKLLFKLHRKNHQALHSSLNKFILLCEKGRWISLQPRIYEPILSET
ncbi:hypothetical protein, partial [Campylobacter cuniculorum]|uniref:hypothetical protein n=1 Tax=Campylobacter cuniculorum TaxID=374106 RepID=UPI0023F3AC55